MRIALSVLFFLFFIRSQAQDQAQVDRSDVNVLMRNEAEGGLTIHSNGFGLRYMRGWHLTGYKKHMLDIEFVSMRHPKQYKLANPYYESSKPFFYGKLNFAYLLRGGYGRQNIIFSKGEKSGVEVRYNYYVGLSLAMTKPVYLDVVIPNDSTAYLETRKYDPADPLMQSSTYIYGPGPYLRGFDEMNFYPGVYGKFAISFEYGGWQDKVTALEVGVVVDSYLKPLPIMANIRNDQVLVNFYISLLWGGKW
ncbi:MAG: hypothetical protein IPP51_03075 [Bacteroidetes bacterium]|nr:hypothetical protein [Bacteroidota bacterium]